MVKPQQIFEIANPLWTTYATMSKEVQKPVDILQFTINKSRGGWVDELIILVSNGFFKPEVLKRLYFVDESATLEHLEQRNKFLVTLLNKRAMSLTATYLIPPYRYSGLASPHTEGETRRKMQEEWILEAEDMAAHGKQVLPLECTHCLRTAFVRLFFLANELDSVGGLQGSASHGVALARTACEHLGDTVVVENTHQKAKDLLRSARHKVASRINKFHSVITSNVLKGRGVDFLQVTHAQKVAASMGKNPNMKLVKATHPNSYAMSKRFQEVMKYKASRPNFNWPSTSHETLFNEAACLQLLVADGCMDMVRTGDIQSAPITCLVGKPGSLVANSKEGRIFMVIAVGTLNFLGWDMEVVDRDENGFSIMQKCRQNTALSWHSVTDLSEWLAIPHKPQLRNRFGPLIHKQCSGPLALAENMVAEGLSLTVPQCKIVLRHYGVGPIPQRKADLYKAIIELFVENPEEQKLALEKSDLKKQDDDVEVDSDLSELEELLDNVEDANNLADPEIKAERSKVKKMRKKRATKNLVEGAAQSDLLLPKKGKGKGKRRGKGRGKAPKKKFGRGRGKRPETTSKPLKEEVSVELSGPTASASQGLQHAAEASALVSPEDEINEVIAPADEGKVKRVKAGTPAPKYHESPHHLLDPLAPPGAKFTLSTMDHRWVCTFKVQAKPGTWTYRPWSQKTYTKSFDTSNWRKMLEDVHEYAWKKWEKTDEPAFSLGGNPRQEPGKLDAGLCVQLDEWVHNLPEAKKYSKLKIA